MKGLGVFAFLATAASSWACYNDVDTNLTELRDNLDVTKAIIGRFTLYPAAYYRRRIEIQKAILQKDPTNLEAYDNISVAYDRICDGESALKWIHEKRKHLANAPNQQLYSTEANEGTFLIVRWIRGHKPGDITDAVEAEKHIEKALKINPNAHFGREFAQLYSIRAMIECGKQENWKAAFCDTLIKIADRDHIDRRKLRFGIAGMMVLGAAWNMPPMIQAMANLVPEDTKVVNLCTFRLANIIPGWDKNEYPLVKVKRANGQELGVLFKLIANGDEFQEHREEWILSQIKKGKHPDTNPDFWVGFTDIAEVPTSEFVVIRHKEWWQKDEFRYELGHCLLTGIIIGLPISYYIYRRRRFIQQGF
ncbi:MAG: hypothetical protein GC165_02775 [Armatimonadetes bacterium]|nr:hypothetical protein [Armatimonadota bacterium]MBS1726796.1 hypothetical protein [Armatimonadota bacterium]